MAVRKRMEITLETDRVVTIRRRRLTRAWCAECGSDVDLVGLAEAEALTGMAGPALREYALARGWHLLRGLDGDDLMCLESWLKSK